jgi:hypothetical protein
MDLLTVVLHEIGHTLGLPDDCGCGPYNTLMQATLPAGVRRSLVTAPAGPPVSVLAPSASAGTTDAANGGTPLLPGTRSASSAQRVQLPAGVRAHGHRRPHRSHRSRAARRHRRAGGAKARGMFAS